MKWPTFVVISMVSLIRLKRTCQQKNITPVNGIAIHYMKEMGPKVGSFASFCHHRLMTVSVHMHAYRYPFFESGMKPGLRMIALCRKNRVKID